MPERNTFLYSPALRMKAGEGEGLRQLAVEIADRILPRFIVPPPGERDESISLPLHLSSMPDIAPFLAGVWRWRQVLVDSTYIMEEFGRDKLEVWLPPMFNRARSRGVCAIPIALLSDINKSVGAFRASISSDHAIKFGIRLRSDEMVGAEFPFAIAETLRDLNLRATECAVIADFGESDFSDPSVVAPIISGILETLQDVGMWGQIIFQGSNYPSTNPAPDNGFVLWPRNEWRAWRLAANFDSATPEHMIFGDYAADCSKIEFKDSACKPICHVRYTTGENWRVQRGKKQDTSGESMHKIFTSIAQSSDFAGSSFSQADRYMALAAANRGEPHGNPTTWRQLNTTHHITQVVEDIAAVRGLKIRRMKGEAVQTSLSLK